MRILVLVFILLVGLGALGLYGRRESLRQCREASSISQAAQLGIGWTEAAEKDRFLRHVFVLGGVADAIRAVRIQAAITVARPISFHLSSEAKVALRALVNAETAIPEKLLPALNAVAHLEYSPECQFTDAELNAVFARGEAFWRSRKAEIRLSKISFTSDVEIYCQAEALTKRLKAVLETTRSRCAQKRCAASVTKPLLQELNDIQKQKEFNHQKLLRKWPEEVLEGLEC